MQSGNIQAEEFVEEDKRSSSFEWAPKTDLAAIVLGDIPFLAEIKLGYNFSIEPGVFITYSDLAARISPVDHTFPDNLSIKNTVGFQVGFRYYISEVFDSKSAFAELNYRYKNLLQVYPNSDPFTAGEEISDQVNSLAFQWGYQFVYINQLLLEMQFGVAYQFGTSTRVLQDTWNPQDYEVVQVDDQFSPMAIRIGLRLGYKL